jgi:flagellar hook-associated protein 2
MALLSFSGLATGIDTGSIVDQLVKIRRRPLELDIASRDATQATRDAFATLESKLLAIRTTLTDLRTPADVLVKTASASDPEVLSATAGTGAHDGITTVTVAALATASRATASTGLGDPGDPVAAGAGVFAFTVGGGDTQSVTLSASTTLTELADAINALGAGAIASVVNVGAPAAPSHKLQIVANATGTTSDIAIVTDGTTLGITAAAGTNAQFTISGFTETIERASNAVTDVIPGVTFVLRQAGASADVVIADDADAILEKVQSFVDAYNDLVAFVRENSEVTRLDAETSTAGPFAANPTARGVLDRLRETVRTAVTDAADGVTTLSQIGIATQQDGSLTFDTSGFYDTFAGSAQGVAEVFGGVGSGDGVGDRLHATITDLTAADGLLDNVQEALDDTLRRADDGIAVGERAVEAFAADLEAQFAALEAAVNTIQSQGDFLVAQLASTRDLGRRNRT